MSSKSWQRVSCNGPGSGRVRARVSRMLVMYSALKAWKASPSAEGARHGIGGIDLGQSQDLADVVAGIQSFLLETVPIGLGIGRQRQEAHHQRCSRARTRLLIRP